MKAAVKEMIKLIQKYGLTYDQISEVCKQARKELKIARPKRRQIQSQLPTFNEIRQFFKIIETKSLVDKLMMKFLFYTGIRTFELVNIEIKNIDFSVIGKEKIWIRRKGGTDSYILIPEVLKDMLKLYLETEAKKNVYLFESSYHKKYTERGIRKKIERYRAEAGISHNVRAHNFRHAILSYLGGKGWRQQQLKNISGHSSTTSLDIYVERNPETVREIYNDAIYSLEKEIFNGKN